MMNKSLFVLIIFLLSLSKSYSQSHLGSPIHKTEKTGEIPVSPKELSDCLFHAIETHDTSTPNDSLLLNVDSKKNYLVFKQLSWAEVEYYTIPDSYPVSANYCKSSKSSCRHDYVSYGQYEFFCPQQENVKSSDQIKLLTWSDSLVGRQNVYNYNLPDKSLKIVTKEQSKSAPYSELNSISCNPVNISEFLLKRLKFINSLEFRNPESMERWSNFKKYCARLTANFCTEDDCTDTILKIRQIVIRAQTPQPPIDPTYEYKPTDKMWDPPKKEEAPKKVQ